MNTEKIVKGIWGAALQNDRAGIRQRIDMYRDRWAEQLREELVKQFSPEAQARLLPLASTEVNLLKKIVDEQAQVYNTAPRRTVKGPDGKPIERWAEIEKESRANTFWKTNNRYTRLCNHTLIKIVSREGSIELDMFLPDQFLIFTDPNDWKEIKAIAIEIGQTAPPKEGNAIERPYERMITQIWAKEDTVTPWGTARAGMVSTAREGKIVAEEPNPYVEMPDADDPAGEAPEVCLPFVLTYKNFPIDKLIELCEGDGNYHATIMIGVLYTLLNEIQKFQSFNQPYIVTPVNTKLPSSQSMGAWSVMSVQTKDGQGAQFGTLQLETDPTKYAAVIQDRIAYILAQNGIPPSAYQIQKSPQSGYAMRIERTALDEIRANDLEYYRDFENEVFEKIRIVNNYHNPKKAIPMDAEFSIDFAENETIYTIDEQIKQETHELANNLTTEAKLLMKRNPDLDEIGATREIMANRIANVNVAPLAEFDANGLPVQTQIEAAGGNAPA